MAGPGDFFTDPVSFIYGGNTGLSYSDLQRRRQIAIALASRQRKFPTNVGEGLTYFGEALGDTIADRRLSAAERQYKGGEDAREAGYTPSSYIPGVNANPPVTGATPSPGAPAGTAANPITPAPIAGPANLFNPTSITNEIPAVDSVPAVQPVRSPAPPPRAGMIDPRSRDLAIKTLYGEAGGEGPVGQAAVAHVIRNRAELGRYGGSDPASVILAKGQFEPWMTEAGRRRMEGMPADTYKRLAGIVDEVWGGNSQDPTGGATHFYSPRAQAALGRRPPTWGRDPTAVIGTHNFYAPEGRAGGAGAPAGSRDAIAAQMTPPPAGPPTARELASQDLLQETVGVGGGGPPYPPTASAGRAGVVTDAPSPGASPLGAITNPSIGDTLQRQRGGGVGGIMPPAQPTVLPAIAQNRARSVPVTASDASMAPLPGSVAPPAGFGAAPAARPAQALPSDDETIPPDLSDRPYPRRYKEPPKEAIVHGPDAAMLRDQRIATGDYSPGEKARAEERLKQATYFMQLKNVRAQEAAKNYREAYEAEDKAEAEWKHKAPERKLETRLRQLETQKAIADRKNDPVTALQLQATLDKTREELARMRFEAGRPRELGLEEKELDVAKKRDEAKAREQVPGTPPNIDITADQANTISHFSKATLAIEQMKRVPDGDKILAEGLRDELAGKLPFFGNKALSDKYRVMRNAADNLVQAHLRDTSGAAFGASELLNTHRNIIPVYGDDPIVRQNKAQQREAIAEGMYLSLGKARPLADYELNKRKAKDAEEQEKLKKELPQVEPGTVVRSKNGRKKIWTGTRWEDDY